MHSFSKVIFFCAAITLFASCDKDFNEIGADIVGDDHYGFLKDSTSTVVAYDQQIGAVQTNKVTSTNINVPINTLGTYTNPVFGKTTAHFVTQLELAAVNPTFISNPVVQKVELTIPYFSKLTATDDDGNHTYTLDSIMGDKKIKLSVYASNYYLRDLDPATGFQEQQKYYSDQLSDFESNLLTPTRLNDSIAPSQNDEFFFDPAEIITYKTVNGTQQVDKRTAPQMQLRLNKQFFQDKIFSAAATGQLETNTLFRQYLRGLLFKVENAASSPDQGSLAQLNFKAGKITITYEDNTSSTVATRIDKTLVLNLAGNTVNLFENQYTPSYLNALSTTDATNGDSRLALKGGVGSMAVIELFGQADQYRWDDDNDPDNANDPNVPDFKVFTANSVPDELDDLRHNKWLINDASLTFYVDRTAMQTEEPAYRLYLYDLKNHKRLVDYDFDVTTVPGSPQYNKYIHGGLYEKSRYRYTIRLTNHLRNLLNPDIDSTNVKLGLVVTEFIGNTSNAKLRTPVLSTVDRIPAASVASRRGVILYGNNVNESDADEAKKKLRLRIYYTKPNEN